MRTRKLLSDLIEGRLSSADGPAALVKLATRLIVEEALVAESRDVLGCDYYEHGASPRHRGWCNGVRMVRLKTADRILDYAAPHAHAALNLRIPHGEADLRASSRRAWFYG